MERRTHIFEKKEVINISTKQKTADISEKLKIFRKYKQLTK